PERPGLPNVGADPAGPLTLQVYSGGTGSFTLYSDADEGTGYANGQFATTPITYREGANDDRDGRAQTEGASSQVTIGADRGRFPGQQASRPYALNIVDVTAPRQVTVDGHRLAQVSAGSDAPGWWYDQPRATLHVRTT